MQYYLILELYLSEGTFIAYLNENKVNIRLSLMWIFRCCAPFFPGCNEELEMMGEIEDTIYQFARKYEPQKELPLEFTCTCGKHLLRHDIYAGMSRFMCDECEAEWLVGPQEV